MWPEFIRLWLLGLLFAVVLMALVWAIAVRIRNAGIVDIAWSAGFAPIAVLFALLAAGDLTRRIVIAALVTLWSLRLGIHLYVRVMSHHPQEDRRYAELRRSWGADVNRKLFGFFEMQALLLAVLSTPCLLICLNRAAELLPLEWLGLALFVFALLGESLADRQLAAFRADPANRGRVCEVGLWHYSRHPNYFFESIVWWGFFVAALGSPYGWVTLACPLLMLYLLLNVTGIPLTEKHSLESRGDLYREYQRTTSRFVPWFPRRI
jgi:steroid 5-alpha reductase family enzyme